MNVRAASGRLVEGNVEVRQNQSRSLPDVHHLGQTGLWSSSANTMMHGVRGFFWYAHIDELIAADLALTPGWGGPRYPHYDRSRGNLDRHGVHFLTAYVGTPHSQGLSAG